MANNQLVVYNRLYSLVTLEKRSSCIQISLKLMWVSKPPKSRGPSSHPSPRVSSRQPTISLNLMIHLFSQRLRQIFQKKLQGSCNLMSEHGSHEQEPSIIKRFWVFWNSKNSISFHWKLFNVFFFLFWTETHRYCSLPNHQRQFA